MSLYPEPFVMIKSGVKTIELRLYDEKRRMIAVGDEIVFTCTEPPFEQIHTKVRNLYQYHSFKELYADLPLLKCGYTEADISAAKPGDMDAYYTKEQQAEFGVVGIEIQLTGS